MRICPACKGNYPDEMVVCPHDRTMLLTPGSQSNVQKIYDWAAGPVEIEAPFCPKCQNEHPPSFFGRCTKDLSPVGTRKRIVKPEPPPLLNDRYRIEKNLGARKLTMCFEATDTETGESVMVQLLVGNLARDEKTVERFKNGASRSSEIAHPGIYKIYRIDDSEGTPFIVGDLLEGRYLSTYLSECLCIKPEDALVVFLKILDALEFAHQQDVIHGNLTTSNISICTSNGDWNVKLMEFGIAERLFRELQWDGPESATRTINVYGETSAMSPEIMRGRHASPKSDIYSLGCIMYEVLSGIPPYDGGSEILTLMHHLNKEPEPFDPGLSIPEELEEIVLKCLEKEPENRFQSASALRKALEKISE